MAAGYRSRKSSAMCIAAIQSGIFRTQKNPPIGAFKIAIVSVKFGESTQRNKSIQELLKWIGYKQLDKLYETDGIPADYYHRSGGGLNQPFSIKFTDGSGDLCNIETGSNSIDFTGFGSNCIVFDEFGLWDGDAHGVLANAIARFAGFERPRLYIMSTPHGEACPMTEMAKAGDNDARFVARVGEKGAARDREVRAELKAFLEARAAGEASVALKARYGRWAADPRLLKPYAADDWRIPSWVAVPSYSIVDLFTQSLAAATSNADKKRQGDALDYLFSAFGAQPLNAGTSALFDPVMVDLALARGAA